MSVSSPPNCTITFREPFPRSKGKQCYIKAYVNPIGQSEIDIPDIGKEQEIQIDGEQQMDIIDYLIQVDKKLTNAVVRCDSMRRWVVIQHSPQADFFEVVK